MMKQYPLLPVGLDVFCKLHPEASTELHSMMQKSDFHPSSSNGLTVFRIPKHGKHNLPSRRVTLNFLVEGELGQFRCIEAHFGSGW
jgi:hypothetical protein